MMQSWQQIHKPMVLPMYEAYEFYDSIQTCTITYGTWNLERNIPWSWDVGGLQAYFRSRSSSNPWTFPRPTLQSKTSQSIWLDFTSNPIGPYDCTLRSTLAMVHLWCMERCNDHRIRI